MSALSPARKAALALVSECRRRDGRIRDIARESKALEGLSPEDRALAMRLSVGSVAASAVLSGILSELVKRSSSLEPRVRDALLVGTFEACYLDTPGAVSASQGVELVRSVAPRAAGMANAVLRRVVTEVRPQVVSARRRCEKALSQGEFGPVTQRDLELVSGLPAWLVGRIMAEREDDPSGVCGFSLGNLEQAPVYVAVNRAAHTPDELERILLANGMEPREVAGTDAFVLGAPQGLYRSGLVDGCDLVVADLSAQRACALAAPKPGERILEVGQGRGTKSVLLESLALAGGGFAEVVGVDSIASKVRVASRRMTRAGLSEHVRCVELDATRLADDRLPDALDGVFDLVFVDAPCSGTGTMRRHPEIASRLTPQDVSELAELQLRILTAAASRVAMGGRIAYATCSVLSEENQRVVKAFLESDAGRGFGCVAELPNDLPGMAVPEGNSPDGHFCAVLCRD